MVRANSGSDAYPKKFRLRTAPDFKRVYGSGKKRSSRTLAVFALPNGLDYNRFGLTTPRKIGKAHQRNRLRRRIREIIRTSRAALPTGFDFVLNPRQSLSNRNFEDLRIEILSLLGAAT